MFRLAKLGFLLSIFLYLKGDVTLCASCIFGKERRRKRIKKGNKSGYIRQETDNNPGARVLVDQLYSNQPIFPQFSGKLTSARIWSS